MSGLPSTEQTRAEHRICAIHQPNFFPWLGYFDKIRRADVFVFLDNVDYPKSGSGMGSWTNRVRISLHGKPHWIGCPLRRYDGRRAIREVEIAEYDRWRRQLLRTLEQNYARAPHFQRAMAVVAPLVEFRCNNLAEFNINAVRGLCEVLGLETEFVRQSDLDVSMNATALLAGITHVTGADAYLCGGGGAGYQDDAQFEAPSGEIERA